MKRPLQLKRPLEALLISPDRVMRANAVSGQKKITIREGHRAHSKGPAILCCDRWGPWAVMVDIVDIKYRLLSEVTREEWEADGFTSQDDLLAGMRVFYHTLELSSPVTVVRWKNVRGFFVDNPEAHQAHLDSLPDPLPRA